MVNLRIKLQYMFYSFIVYSYRVYIINLNNMINLIRINIG